MITARKIVETAPQSLRFLALGTCLALTLTARAALVDLATSPLATSSTTTVKPNLLYVLDDSGSMTWTYMPDAANNFRGDYGYHSSQCNGVYYNPDITYDPPLGADKVAYPNASFTAAWDNGFDATTTTRNLNSEFIANRFVPDSANSTYSGYGSYLGGTSLGPYGAFYYRYSGTATKDFSDTSSTFYTECNTSLSSASAVFSKRRLSTAETTTIVVSGSNSTSVSSITVNGFELMSGATTASTNSATVATRIAANINACTTALTGSCTAPGYSATVSGSTITLTGPTTGTAAAANHTPIITKSGTMSVVTDVFPDTTASKLTNFANWYSYYRTRIQMMKTSSGRAFSELDGSYRIGLLKINGSGIAQAVEDFESTHRSNWYSSLYGVTPNGGTPLRAALSKAGRYFAGKLSGTDPVQYSCQQNFTLLSTDGYWNGSAGYQLDGSTDVGNQDGGTPRPFDDGATTGKTVNVIYSRNSYTKVKDTCGSGKKRLKTQPQNGSCTVSVTEVTGTESCTPSFWTDVGAATVSGACTYDPAPPASEPVKISATTSEVAIGGTSDTLADVAMYYYQTDLRTPALDNCGTPISPATVGPLCENNVFSSSADSSTQQHMTTFTLGLGASGRMKYSATYLTDTVGDYLSVKLGSKADSTKTPPICSWQADGTVCNWPTPDDDKVENIDDMWHAAVNGRGAYFSATDPKSLSAGLANALAGLKSRKGSAAAAATSTLNPVTGNNFAYVASYSTVKWTGNLERRGINVDTGAVNKNADWCVENVVADDCKAPGSITSETVGETTIAYCATPDAVICPGGVMDGSVCKVPVATSCTGTMNAKVDATADTRTIKTANSTGTALIDFNAEYAAGNPTSFSDTKLHSLSQWTSLTEAQQSAVTPTNLVNFLRGQNGYEDRVDNEENNRVFRYREAVLGDALESQPAFVSSPVFSYPYPGYSAFATAQAGRAEVVYMGTNDGMMHAFSASTGNELWAYVPSMVIPNMWKLADKNYSALHTNFVNGSPITSDICTANCSCDDVCVAAGGTAPVWKTILVGGLNGGGRGYYALDITTPSSPVLLWELTTTTGVGLRQDDDVGYSFGQPVITRKADGTWVVLVTSGYNNATPGDGKGYLFVLNAGTGEILGKISTGVGSSTTPSGLARITAWNNEPAGNQAGFVYGGDLQGNLWRFNINSTASATIGTGEAFKFATLFSDTAASKPQPITAAPALGKIAGKRVVFIGTGKYLEVGDLTTTQTQTQYAIKDDDATTTIANPRTTLVNQTLTDNPDHTATRLGSNNAVDFYTGRGWYIDLPDNGERVNIDGKLVQGTLLFPTLVPSNSACSPGGYGWLNYVNYKTGGALDATGLASMKFANTIVGLGVVYVDGVPKIEIVTSGDPTPQPPPDVPFASTAPGFSGKRVLWRELIP